jgi:hypothetical protein
MTVGSEVNVLLGLVGFACLAVVSYGAGYGIAAIIFCWRGYHVHDTDTGRCVNQACKCASGGKPVKLFER